MSAGSEQTYRFVKVKKRKARTTDRSVKAAERKAKTTDTLIKVTK
ncbi:hypothetical protein ABH968_002086 [Lysinibacillus sp. RC79]